ncbi:hypothetical protein Q7C36_013425 [Tachysurus vachellii]|uniref:Uncharacterized protein n=1 Tax=Tachysurus vachellii TaxID=175792 RepID=A0AA88MMP6_TACVA|nr:hypothetical protein Q7C36_013425 [Tachysurus vachellii]
MCEGLFVICNTYEGFSSCATFPAWMVAFCVSALIAFIVSIEEQMPEMSKFLGWAFYICCATLVYASLLSVALGFVEGSSSIEPVNPDGGQGLPAPALSPDLYS